MNRENDLDKCIELLDPNGLSPHGSMKSNQIKSNLLVLTFCDDEFTSSCGVRC